MYQHLTQIETMQEASYKSYSCRYRDSSANLINVFDKSKFLQHPTWCNEHPTCSYKSFLLFIYLKITLIYYIFML